MGGFFSIDGAFYKWGSILADMMILTFLWLLCSIPIFTMGAATTALYYVTSRRLKSNEGYLFRDFFSSFRQNFKQATILWLVYILVLFVLYTNIRNIYVMGDLAPVFYVLELVLALELIIMGIYLLPMLSRFDMPSLSLLKAAFVMANKHILTTITCLACGVAAILAILQWPPLIIIGMGGYSFVSSYFLMRVFKKYRPEIESNTVYDDFAESRRTLNSLSKQLAEQSEGEVSIPESRDEV